MEEKEPLTNASGEEKVEDTADYLNAIKQLKENTVSKEAYLKLKEENKQLLNSFVNGEALPTGDKPVENKASVEELKEALHKSKNDLEYVKTALELRERILEKDKKDIFANYATDNLSYELEEADKVAKVLSECVDLAEGSPEVFKAQLMARTVDTPILPRKRR